MSKINKGVMSSDKMDWETPPEFMAAMADLGMQFDLDACAVEATAKAPRFFTPDDDALIQNWDGKVWMNPPYGAALPQWLAYAHWQAQTNPDCESVTCLVPARTDTKWFHDIAVLGDLLFLKGRVSFLQNGEKVGSPAFPSMLVIYSRAHVKTMGTWDWRVK